MMVPGSAAKLSPLCDLSKAPPCARCQSTAQHSTRLEGIGARRGIQAGWSKVAFQRNAAGHMVLKCFWCGYEPDADPNGLAAVVTLERHGREAVDQRLTDVQVPVCGGAQ